jgi:cohesin loading factor subunit SCC2
VSAIKNQLSNIIYPFAEGLGDIHGKYLIHFGGFSSCADCFILGCNSVILESTLRSSSSASQAHRKQIGAIFQALSAAIPHIDALVRRSSPTLYSSKTTDIAMSDAIVIQIVYIAIGPFFIVESSTVKASSKDKTNPVLAALGGNTALRGLRLTSLSLIRSVSNFNFTMGPPMKSAPP